MKYFILYLIIVADGNTYKWEDKDVLYDSLKECAMAAQKTPNYTKLKDSIKSTQKIDTVYASCDSGDLI
jgi:hypothetical protein